MHVLHLADTAGDLIALGDDLAGLGQGRTVEVDGSARADVQGAGVDIDDPATLEVDAV